MSESIRAGVLPPGPQAEQREARGRQNPHVSVEPAGPDFCRRQNGGERRQGVGQFVHIVRSPGEYPRYLGGKTLEERDEAQRRVPAQGVVVFVSRRAPWATVLLCDAQNRPMYRESFALGQLRAEVAP